MRCEEFFEQYSTYRDGNDPLLAALMEDHMASCPDCRGHDAAVRWGVEALRADSPRPSPDFERRLQDRLEGHSGAPDRRAPQVAPLAATAVALLMLTLLTLAIRRRPVITPAAAEADPPSVARPLAHAGIPFVTFVPSP